MFLFDEETNSAFDMLKESMTQYCAVCTADYKHIVNVHQEKDLKNSAYSDDLFLTDPPYNTSPSKNRVNCYKDQWAHCDSEGWFP